ncbi:uncharacterized protein PRCAT00003458001 [Priceomyces carsonii]|uniref:uncharacterized protein n=1 Tax=Priceomyces carsonii TaxID=28549 RepID=UPI002ED8A0C8|nr:unnamed protein product [Priceomyces carsonii]
MDYSEKLKTGNSSVELEEGPLASNSSTNEFRGFNDATESIRNLARQITNRQEGDVNTGEELRRYLSSMSQVPGISPFEGEDSRLDPDSDEFSARFWVKNLKKLQDSDDDYYKPSTLGVAYRNLRAYGKAADSDYQSTFANVIPKFAARAFNDTVRKDSNAYFDILKQMDAIMRPGEVTVVLGRPGSGCSTLLKTIACQTYGFHVDKSSKITYDGLTPKNITTQFRGEVVYAAETDVHFPHLTVGTTLDFAARLRTPRNRGPVDRETYAKHMASVYMATYGLSHTRDTKVGNDFVRGVSGGERKRVSIAEVSLSGANLQCWDNATRGLDSATALEFVRALKTTANVLGATPIIAIYQCSQDAYDLFDNVVLLYEGRQIFFGKADLAKAFFINMGFDCPKRQTTADFLTSITNPSERIVRSGFENLVPRTSEEFESYWRNSGEYFSLIKEIDAHFGEVNSSNVTKKFHDSHIARQAKYTGSNSPYTVSFLMQTKYLMWRDFARMRADPSISIFIVVGQTIMSLILSSVFYNLSQTTGSFFYRGSGLFFAVLFNAFSSMLEIMTLFEARPIVEKHRNLALYRPAADAFAGIISQLPVKFLSSAAFNIIFYFMANLRREAGRFFFYWLFCFLCTLVMSHLFRSLGAVSTSLAGAMTPATCLLLALCIFTGFAIPTPSMLGWSRWINYINPVGYVFESLMANEFHNREFECSEFVPSGPGYTGVSSLRHVCSAVGSKAGSSVVNGTDYIAQSFEYYNSHKWRNLGIVIGFILFFLVVYIILTEYNKGAMQKGEVALFLRSSLKKTKREQNKIVVDVESGSTKDKIKLEELNEPYNSNPAERYLDDKKLPSSDETFLWKNLTYEVKIKSETRVILDHVDGWVKPGELTALMGSSGAGKTTLLNCLSERVTTGVITDGIRMVNGHSLDESFQRSIGYVQQQDLHLEKSTVREALKFSAQLRQSNLVPDKEKFEYVEYIIDLLEMSAYADAVVGVAGEGLNVEQRKRLTIGVELAAKPKLLLFLDEPTSGLDSQTAWSICKLIRKLADHGQAILCTIHQPSALLLQEFDRLLFLQKGGRTVYFGDLGDNCNTLINYFEKYGAKSCPEDANPAEWMLEVVGAAPGSHANQDYFEVWKNSAEFLKVQSELEYMEKELVQRPRDTSPEAHKRFAASLWKQYILVTKRVFEQSWRDPGYLYSKLFLVVSSSLFNGFSFFKAKRSIQGLLNQMFSIFMFLIVLNTLVQQVIPFFVKQRALYEVREAPSRTFSWFAFISAQITSEIPYQFLLGTVAFFVWYYPVGFYENAAVTDTVNSRGVLMWLFITVFFIYASTMAQICISFNELPDNAANLANLCFTLCLIFCGVMAPVSSLPGFWIFMYRLSPFTYLIQGVLSTGLANADIQCSSREFLHFVPPGGETCGKYMADYIKVAGGYLKDSSATDECQFCTMSSTNSFLASISSYYDQRWRNFGIFICFIAFNIIGTVFFYWLARVPKGNREKKS